MRAKVVALFGVVIVPIVTYYAPTAPEIGGALLAFVLVWIEPGPPIAELGLERPRKVWRTLVLGVGFGVGLFLLNRLLMTPMIEHVTGIRRDLTRFDYLRGNVVALLKLLPLIWLTAGFCEELVYRAYLITRIGKLFGGSNVVYVAGCFVAATIFGLAHSYQGVPGMLVTGTLGVLLGFLFLQQRRNLCANITAHLVVDTVSLSAICFGFDRSVDKFGRALFGL
jgi:membrane protease YdiL (CAAX protease family)